MESLQSKQINYPHDVLPANSNNIPILLDKDEAGNQRGVSIDGDLR
jgi:hypothetical protein